MFHLSKWYGDCVSADGDARIAYCANLRWGAITLDYGSVLEKRGTAVSTREGTDDGWHWRARDPELRLRIYESADGFIDWHCIHPRASVDTGDIRGVGYREHLQLTIAPWKLPMRELRWGRFLSEHFTVIWIDWQGDFQTQVVFRNGKRVTASGIADEALAFADGTRLELDRGFVLREGPIGTTVLASIPVLSRTAPARMMAMTELKWLSRGRYQGDEGWAIHEVVRWP